MWEQTFTESFTAPAFSFAPSAGRFALSRLTTSSPVAPDQDMNAGFQSQTVTVYQTESGRQDLLDQLQPHPASVGKLRASRPPGRRSPSSIAAPSRFTRYRRSPARTGPVSTLLKPLCPSGERIPSCSAASRTRRLPTPRRSDGPEEQPIPAVSGRSRPSEIVPTTERTLADTRGRTAGRPDCREGARRGCNATRRRPRRNRRPPQAPNPLRARRKPRRPRPRLPTRNSRATELRITKRRAIAHRAMALLQSWDP